MAARGWVWAAFALTLTAGCAASRGDEADTGPLPADFGMATARNSILMGQDGDLARRLLNHDFTASVTDRLCFAPGSAALPDGAGPVLAAQAGWMADNPALSFAIFGTGDAGPGNHDALAQARARAVVAGLVAQGVAPARLAQAVARHSVPPGCAVTIVAALRPNVEPGLNGVYAAGVLQGYLGSAAPQSGGASAAATAASDGAANLTSQLQDAAGAAAGAISP